MTNKVVGVSYLANLNTTSLRELNDVVHVICLKKKEPLAVLISYELFLQMQDALDRLQNFRNGIVVIK